MYCCSYRSLLKGQSKNIFKFIVNQNVILGNCLDGNENFDFKALKKKALRGDLVKLKGKLSRTPYHPNNPLFLNIKQIYIL